MPDVRRKAASGFIYVAFYSAAVRIMQFGGLFIFAKLLQPEDIGACALGMILVTGLVMFREMGFTPALMQIQDEVEQAFNSATALIPVLGWTVFLLIYVAAPLFCRIMGDESIIALVQFLGLIAPFSALAVVPAVYLQRQMQFRRKVLPETLSVLIAFSAGVYLAYQGYGAWSYAAALVLTEFFRGFFYWIAVGLMFTPKIDLSMWKRLIKYGYNVSLGSVSGFIYSLLDQLMVGKFFGKTMLGHYSIAMKINNMLPSGMVILSNQVMLAILSSLQSEKEAYRRAYLKGLTFFAIVSFPLAAGILFFGGGLLQFFYGHKWDQAIIVLQILALYGLLRSIGELNGEVFFSKGQPRYFKYQGLARTVVVLLFLPLALRFNSIEAIAALFTVVLLFTAAFTFLWAAKLMEESIFRMVKIFLPHLAGIAAGWAMMTAFSLLSDNLCWRIIIFYLGYGILFHFLTKEEIRGIRSFIKEISARRRTE